jgi:flagellar biogenesis protein FliO
MNAHTPRAALLVLLAGSLAAADEAPPVAITDRADHVEIVVPGASAARGRPEPRGPWLDVPLDKAPRAGTVTSSEADEVTKRADIYLGERPRLSVLLHHDARPEDFARNTQVEQTAGAVVVRIPHVAGHVLPPIARPAPAAPPVAATIAKVKPAKVEAAAPAAAPTAARAVPPEITVTPVAPSPTILDEKVAASVPEGAALAAIADDKPLLGAAASEANHNRLYLVMLLLSALGVLSILVARRRRQATPAAQLLRVTSTCQLSPKVKVMLVSVGDRELLLSVGDQGAQVLARWRAEGNGSEQAFELDEPLELEVPPAAEAAPPAAARERAAYRASRGTTSTRSGDLPDIDLELPPAAPGRPAPSPAVAGLLKLRRDGRGAGNAVADEQWARDLLAAMRSTATGRSRGIVR